MSSHRSVLVVLAQPPAASRVQTTLSPKEDGWRLRTVSGPEAAQTALKAESVAAILWDEAFGLEAFTRFLTEHPEHPGILLSAAWDGEKAGRALRAGAQDVLVLSELDPSTTPRRVAAAIQRHALVLERNEVLERLRRLEKFKTEFINTAAHELNSPLTPVKLQLHLLQTTHAKGLAATHKHSLEIVGRNVDRLIQLVSDTLDAARLQASRLTVKKQPVDLQRLALEAVQSHRAAAEGKRTTLVLRQGAPHLVEADPDRIMQVLGNLLGNAVKFTPPGGKITLSVKQENDGVVVRVQDTGIGLRPEDFPRLFQPFSQTHEWIQGPRIGSGLGLYICQGIVEQHGGRIWCDSPGKNQGATFAFALPVSRGPTGDGPALQPSRATVRRTSRFWPILYFKCPTCGSRDINMRILRNKYECRACTDEWQ